jgi:hypothetical protein
LKINSAAELATFIGEIKQEDGTTVQIEADKIFDLPRSSQESFVPG